MPAIAGRVVSTHSPAARSIADCHRPAVSFFRVAGKLDCVLDPFLEWFPILTEKITTLWEHPRTSGTYPKESIGESVRTIGCGQMLLDVGFGDVGNDRDMGTGCFEGIFAVQGSQAAAIPALADHVAESGRVSIHGLQHSAHFGLEHEEAFVRHS